MKKLFKIMVISLLLFTFLVPYTAFAEIGGTDTEWQDIALSEEEFNAILKNNPNNDITPYTSGLIKTYSISIGKSGSNLIIAGKTNCSYEVTKCGFTKVTIQQRKNSSSSWSEYKSYTDLYNNTSIYNLSKTIAVPSGYQYRVTCKHYAKKNIFSTESISNTSNTVTF